MQIFKNHKVFVYVRNIRKQKENYAILFLIPEIIPVDKYVCHLSECCN